MINFKVITLFNRVTESCLVPILIVGLPRFELGLTEPKSVVLPLHHSPLLKLSIFTDRKFPNSLTFLQSADCNIIIQTISMN